MNKILKNSQLLSLGLGSLLLLTACETGAKKASTAAPTSGGGTQVVQPLADSTPIIEYNGGKVTAADVNQFVSAKLSQMNEDAVEAYNQGAERVLIQKLIDAEAKKQGVASAEELIAKVATPAPISDEQVKKFIKENDLEKGFKDPRTGQRKPVSKEDVKKFLSEQDKQGKQQAFIQGLLAQAGAHSVLEEKKTEIIANPASPILGGASAKVVIEEFSDFQCPYCVRAHGVVQQINQAYGDKVKLVFRHFPLTEIHPEAQGSSVASQCAGRQGKFWAMHDKLFANNHDLNVANYIKWGKEIPGIDAAQYENCVKNQETAKEIAADVEAGRKAGVNGTPTFFINGKRAKVAPQIEAFKPLIDAELAKK